MFTNGSVGTVISLHLGFIVLIVLSIKGARQLKHRKHRNSWRILQPYILVSAGAHQPGLSYTYTQRLYLCVFWFNKEHTKEILVLRSQDMAAPNNIVHYFYRCTVHFEDSLSITPTNAVLYHLLIKIA